MSLLHSHTKPKLLSLSLSIVCSDSDSTGHDAMNVNALTPILTVSDIMVSFGWFEKLEWTISFKWGEPVGIGSVCSGEVEMFLCEDAQGGRGKNSEKYSYGAGGKAVRGVWMSLWMDDVDEVAKLCNMADFEVTMPLTDMPWNVREMHIRHSDGQVFREGNSIHSL